MGSFHEKIVNYRCKICQKGFFDKAHCQLHETSHYNDNDEYVPIVKSEKKKRTKVIKNQLFPCNQCQKSFAFNYRLKRHILTVHTPNKDKPFQCSYNCGYATARKYSLSEHEKSHKNERNEKCPHCGARFNQYQQLKRHIANIHERNHKCPHCDRGFGSARYLNIHISKVHKSTKDKVYKCRYCRFKHHKKHKVEKHELVHNAERPFECDVCFKKFRRNHDVVLHKKKAH